MNSATHVRLCVLGVGMLVVSFCSRSGARAEEKGAIVLPLEPSIVSSGRRLALLIGVEAFDDPTWPRLRHPRSDVVDLGNALRQRAHFQTHLLLGNNTTRSDVLRALDRLTKDNKSADDTVVVYFSTHGTLARLSGKLEQVLVVRDTQPKHPRETGLPLEELFRVFDRLESKKKVLILAACYSGAGKSAFDERMRAYVAGLKAGPAAIAPLHAVSRASIILSASAWGETAREDDALGHDVYTHYLLEALNGYDPNGDGATSVTEAHDFARRKTYAFSQGGQRPTAILTVEGEDPIVLAGERTNEGDPVILGYEPELEGYRVRVNGLDKGTLPAGITVEPGWHELRVEVTKGARSGVDPEHPLFTERIYLREGERTSLLELMAREPTHQIEARLGVEGLPGVEAGRDIVYLASATAALRLSSWPLSRIDLSLLPSIAYGTDYWRFNQDELPVEIINIGMRAGLGTHVELGFTKFNFDLVGGPAFVIRRPDSKYFDENRSVWAGTVGLSTTARIRLARTWSLGANLTGSTWFGGLRGLGVQASVAGTWSF